MWGALDVRVFVAAGRALWDYVGKDLWEFVEALQEARGGDGQGGGSSADGQEAQRNGASGNNSAWRARQHASLALGTLDGTFRDAFTAALGGATQQRDLRPPSHVDKAHKLLERSDPAANMNFSPF